MQPDPAAVTPPPVPNRVARRAVLAGLASGVAALAAACLPSPTPAPSPSASAAAASSSAPPSSSATPSSSPSAAVSSSPSASPSPSITPSPSPVDQLAHKVAGLLIVGFRGMRLANAAWVRTAITRDGLGGVILFDRDQLTGLARNVTSPSQVAALTRELRGAAGTNGLVIGVDQEGGIVTRLGPSHGFPAVASEATVGAGTVSAARTWARTIATTLADAGCNFDFAPVVDLDVNPTDPAIGALHRAFSANPDTVVQMAGIELDALRLAGVHAAAKHFPGIGSATVNTDFGVADVTKTWTRTELEPYRRLNASGKLDAVMVGHVVNGQLGAHRPASLSRPTLDLLRTDIGFDGPAVTDDLQAAAITQRFGADEAILLALEAGNDLLLLANQQVYDSGIVRHVVGVVIGAVAHGRLTGEQIDRAWARRQALLGLPA
ncbi:MAG TPA: glycoside hydrolase family 3 N-terminal domain-containing protein [Candidatus Limnocylindrales bacterium]